MLVRDCRTTIEIAVDDARARCVSLMRAEGLQIGIEFFCLVAFGVFLRKL